MALSSGDVFAGYTLERRLGSGGMGTVFLARHPRLPRSDALKLLRPEMSEDPSFAARFVREADLVSRLDHRHIVPVLDRGVEEGQLWLSMRYVPGTDAEELLRAEGGLLPAGRAVAIVRAVAAALDYAHRQGLVHRDVKPANILLSPGDDDEPEHIYLTDFGIAKAADISRLTSTGAVLATFDYASPEQLESRSVDHRSDGYSLGCVLYRLLTGSVPFPGQSLAAAIHGHLTLPPPRPTALCPWLPPGLDAVIAKAMAKDPAGRFVNCRELALAAEQALTEFPEAPGPPYRVRLTGAGHTGAQQPSDDFMPTDVLTASELDRMTDLVRRTRFFELPEQLAAAEPEWWSGAPPTAAGATAGTGTTVEIAVGEQIKRVSFDPDRSRRPPEFDELTELVGRTLRAPPTAAWHQQPAGRAEPVAASPVPLWTAAPPTTYRSVGSGSGSGSGSPEPAGGSSGRTKWIIVAAVVALLAGGLLAAVILLADRGSDPGTVAGGSSEATIPSEAPAPSTTPTPSDGTASSDPSPDPCTLTTTECALLASLPTDYFELCRGVNPRFGGSTELECAVPVASQRGENYGGVIIASEYPDYASRDAAVASTAMQPDSCGQYPAKENWTDGASIGRVHCYLDGDDKPALLWTYDATPLTVVTVGLGADVEALYEWFNSGLSPALR